MSATTSALAALKKKNHGAVYMLYELIKNEKVETKDGQYFTLDQFKDEWPNGGKAQVEEHWRDSANRPTGRHVPTNNYPKSCGEGSPDRDSYYEKEFMQGKHEWIPTNMLDLVVDLSCRWRNPRWFYLAEVLRIPTRLVVVRPEKVGVLDLPLTGHVGALYTQGSADIFVAVTKGQAVFHDKLRDILRKHIERNDIKGYEADFWEHLEEYYWQGEGFPDKVGKQESCPYFYNSGSNKYESWGANMGEMAKKLEEGWRVWKQVAHTLFGTVDNVELLETVIRSASSQSHI